MATPWINADGSLVAGIYYDMRDSEYQALDAIRASTMKEALQSAKQLRYRMDNARADTGALRLGRAVHVAVLQPDVYAEETAIIPDEFATSTGLSKKKPALAWAQQFVDAGVTVISEREDATAHAIADAVDDHKVASETLALATGREVTAIWYETTPLGVRVACKARADAIGGGILADLKTTRETAKFNAHGVAGVIAKFQYHFQFGFYERGFVSAAAQSDSVETFTDLSWVWLFVQSSAPHDVIVCEADEEMEDLGRWYAQSVWESYASALDSGEWPGVAPEKITIQLPRWAVPFENDDGNADGVIGIKAGRL